jgi:hypothetical protein
MSSFDNGDMPASTVVGTAIKQVAEVVVSSVVAAINATAIDAAGGADTRDPGEGASSSLSYQDEVIASIMGGQAANILSALIGECLCEILMSKRV